MDSKSVRRDGPPSTGQSGVGGSRGLKRQPGIDMEKFDPTLVTIYLRAFNCIDETHWSGLDEILASDPRLALKAAAPAAA